MKSKSFFWCIIDYIIDFFFPPKEALCGKLTVSGQGSLEFKFKQYVEDICVYFEEDDLPIPCNPCNPGQDDELDWYICHRHGHYVLVIAWNVASQRSIRWHIDNLLSENC